MCLSEQQVGLPSISYSFHPDDTTSPEKLQAIQSPRTDWACKLIPKYLGTESTSLATRIQLDCTRAKDFVGIARIAYCCESLPTVRLSIVSGLEAWLKQSSKPSAAFKNSIDTVLQTMSTLASTPEYNAAFTEIKERVAPVEFIFIGMIFFYLYRGHPLTEIYRRNVVYPSGRLACYTG